MNEFNLEHIQIINLESTMKKTNTIIEGYKNLSDLTFALINAIIMHFETTNMEAMHDYKQHISKFLLEYNNEEMPNEILETLNLKCKELFNSLAALEGLPLQYESFASMDNHNLYDTWINSLVSNKENFITTSNQLISIYNSLINQNHKNQSELSEIWKDDNNKLFNNILNNQELFLNETMNYSVNFLNNNLIINTNKEL